MKQIKCVCVCYVCLCVSVCVSVCLSVYVCVFGGGGDWGGGGELRVGAGDVRPVSETN